MISMNKYNLLMEHVNPSPDLEQRLHDALDKPPVRKPPAWRRYGAAAACLVLIIGGTAVTQMNRTPANPDGEGKEPPVAAAAPQDYAATDALAAAALSFPLALPQTLPDGYAFDSASDQFGMAVVVYADAEGHTLKYCMGKGEDALDRYEPHRFRRETRGYGRDCSMPRQVIPRPSGRIASIAIALSRMKISIPQFGRLW